MVALRRQPQGRVQIDWNNPITRGLVFAYATTATGLVGYGSSGANNVPFVATYGLQFGNAIGAAVVTPQGYGAKTLIANNPIVSPPDFPAAQSSSFSLFALATGPSSGTQSAIDDDDGSTRRYQFRLNAGKVEFIPFSSGGAQTLTFASALSAADLARGFTMGATAGPGRYAAFQNGQMTSVAPSGSLQTPTAKPTLGMRKSGTQQWSLGGLCLLCSWSRTLTDSEMRSLAANPWQLFAAQDDDVEQTSVAPSGITADIAWVESDDAVSLAGTLNDAASLSWTEADDTYALAATLTNRASAAWTEADDAVSIAASITDNTVSAGIAWTETDDSVSVTVTANDRASLSWTEQDDVVSMSGNVATPAIPVTADIGWTEQDDGFSAFMQVATGGAPGYDVKRKRYVVRKGGQLLVFTDPELAKQVLHADDEPAPKQYPAKKQAKALLKPEPKPEPVPEQRVDLNELRALAEKQHAEAEYKRLLAQKQYETMLTLLERLREEEEDDWLLMSVD
jgi:hypothetical protein